MRDFINAVFSFIGASNLTDEEFESIEIESQTYTSELYEALLEIIDARELVSGTRDRLTYFFLAKGVSVSASSPAKSNILIGGAACE